ncbi:MAG: HAD family hydrolase [Bacteroidota bacterium]
MLCTDIDGTLLNKDRNLSALTISEMKRISDQIPIVLISSRMPKAMRHLQESLGILDLPLIAYNGGLILDQGRVLQTTEIPNVILKDTIEACRHTNIHLSLYNNDDWFVPEMDYWAKREAHNTKVEPVVQTLDDTFRLWEEDHKGAHKIMAMGEETEIDGLFASLESDYRDQLHLYRSKPTYIEIAHRSISKETAISVLLKERYTDFEFGDIIAFGDNYNDIEMLKAVGMGIAVANAKAEVLEIANDVSLSNVDDGVAVAIQKYFE